MNDPTFIACLEDAPMEPIQSFFLSRMVGLSWQSSNLRRAVASSKHLYLLVQDYALAGFSFLRVYRVVLCSTAKSTHVAVLVSNIKDLQVAVDMMMVASLVSFKPAENYQRCFNGHQPTLGHCVGTRSQWPPARNTILRATYGNRLDLITPEVNEVEIQADILLFHGLGGDARLSWTASTNGNTDPRPWPSWHLLSSGSPHGLYADNGLTGILGSNSLPGPRCIRIISINHKLSSVSNDHSNLEHNVDSVVGSILKDLRRARVGLRPTIWLGHSLGGLLVKEVLHSDHLLPLDEQLGLEMASTGVLFYGAPHKGTSLSTVGIGTEFKMSSGSFSVSFNIHSPAMHYLSLNPDMVQHREILNDFFFRQTRIPFVNFQEARPVHTPGRLMQIVHGHESDVVSTQLKFLSLVECGVKDLLLP
ncbi:hypothetical protein CPB86DRAFT_474417 [Serendipita vermifera]|nr:hypothetical protein CPB86DRAFT_474417 [Serendipita vermifera]